MATDEYSIHQARQFHTYAKEAVDAPGATRSLALTNLMIAVEYLIEQQEQKYPASVDE
jgi:hypothetical protein